MCSDPSHDAEARHHHFPRPHDTHGAVGPVRGRAGFGHGGGGGGFGPFGGRGFGPGGPGFGGPRGFMPPGPQRRRKGAARDAILSLLAEAPANGYGLIKAIADRTGGSWNPSPGSVYPTLQQLVDEGLIEAIGEDRRTEFQLTDEGRAYAAAHEDELAGVWQGSAEHVEATADLHESVGKLMGVVQQFRFAATDEQRTAAIAQLDETRRALYRILGE